MYFGIYSKKKPKKLSKLPKEKTLPALKKDLDKVFNAYIRRRDTIYSEGRSFFICISCTEPKTTDQMHAGHFHSAGHNEAVRWDERNVNGQCIKCNTYLHGNFGGYLKGMVKKWGQNVVDSLELKRHNKSKMFKFELELLIKEYKTKLDKLPCKSD
jgi:5-methylcytosine-specific restriction endonuclease McrA